jgi:hypothetical protein
MLLSVCSPSLMATNEPHKPQVAQLLLSFHGVDAKVGLTATRDATCCVLLPLAADAEGEAESKGLYAGGATVSVYTICSILSSPSKIGFCAFLRSFSRLRCTRNGIYSQRHQRHQVCQPLLDLLRLGQHFRCLASVFHRPM